MTDTLATICNEKRAHIAAQKAHISENALLASVTKDTRGFAAAIAAKVAKKEQALIAEVKKASPSKGIIRADFDPAQLAGAYAQGGATCLSVLTDAPYFQGADEYLVTARSAVTLPVLRKDFMLEPYQIIESRALGADAVLLIMAALSDTQARELEAAALALHMDVLVEVHDRAELERALTHLTSPLLGINNRNLKTLAVDLATSETLAALIPPEKIGVCESGISTHADLVRMNAHGLYCFLVGESLMRAADVATATRTLLGGSHA